MHEATPRYVVGVPGASLVYEGEIRFFAWLTWLRSRRGGAKAFDRRSWVIDPAYWLIGESPSKEFSAGN